MEADRKSKRKSPPISNSDIPDKLYFRIGEVANLLDIGSYVLRFWESEFPQLHPAKGGSGQRLYRRRDVETALRIKQLLYDERYTIYGARQLLKSELRGRQAELPLLVVEPVPNPAKLRRVHSELQEIASLLARPLPGTRRVGTVAPKERGGEYKGLHLAEQKLSGVRDKTHRLLGFSDDAGQYEGEPESSR